MTATRKLFVNWLTKKLQVSDSNGGIVTLPNFNKYENVPFEIVIVEPDNSSVGRQAFSRVDISALSMSMSLHSGFDTASPLAYQNTFAKDESTDTFSGSLSLNTVALNAWIGSSESKSGYFEIEIQEGANVSKIYLAGITVQNAIAQVGAVVPSPVDEYFTKPQVVAQFLPRFAEAGTQITLTSPDGTRQRIIGIGNGGELIDQVL